MTSVRSIAAPLEHSPLNFMNHQHMLTLWHGWEVRHPVPCYTFYTRYTQAHYASRSFMCNKIADIMTCTPWAPRMHTRGRGQVPPRLTRGGGGGGGGADWDPRMNTWRLFSRERTELLELRKAIAIQANDRSVYNSFQRISHGCHGRAERGAILLETYR